MKKEYKIHGLFEISAIATATAILPLAMVSTDPAAAILIAYLGSTMVHQFAAYVYNAGEKMGKRREQVIAEYRKTKSESGLENNLE